MLRRSRRWPRSSGSRSRSRTSGGSGAGSRRSGGDSAHRPRSAMAEWHRRELQREVPGRVPQHGVVPLAVRGRGDHRDLEGALQRGSPPLEPGIPHAARVHEEARAVRNQPRWRGRSLVSRGPKNPGRSARRAIQATVAERRAPEGNLLSQIDWLAAQGVITKDIATWAHEVPFVGNDGAHPPGKATESDAKDAVELAEQFLAVVYVSPAIAEARKRARETSAKK